MSVQGYYDESAGAYDSQQRLLYFKVYDSITWKFTEPHIPRERTAVVLDAAGGTGKWSIPIANKGPRVVLLDLSSGMLDVARKKIADQGLSSRIDARHGDVTNLDFQNETFDLVFCDHALGFFGDAARAIAELVRVLKRGSPIVISAQNRYPLSLSLFAKDLGAGTRVLEGKEPFLMRGRVPVHTLFPEEFRDLLERSGIRISKLIGKGITLTPLVLPMEKFYTDSYDQEFSEKIMKVELDLCERVDALPLAGHIQAVGYKA